MNGGAKTGNVFLDAWLSAMAPIVPPVAPNEGAESPDATSEEGRKFLGNFAPVSVAGFDRWAQAAAGVAGTWSELAQRSFGTMTAVGNLASAGDPLGKALEESFGVLGDAGGSAAQTPAALAEAAAVTTRLFAAREAYRAFMMATWQRAFAEVMREAMAQTSAGKPPVTPAQWLALSNSVADRVFVESFNTEAYLEVQGRLSSALADQRRSEMALVETFAQFGHFATRRALDDVGAEVSELRRRLRKLERTRRKKPASRADRPEGASDGR